MPTVMRPNTEVRKLCPECGAEIDHLNYSCSRSEFGRFIIYNNNDNDGDHETEEDGDSDGYTYSCPECNEEIGDDWTSFQNPPDYQAEIAVEDPTPTGTQNHPYRVKKKPTGEFSESLEIHELGRNNGCNHSEINRGDIFRSMIVCSCGQVILLQEEGYGRIKADKEVECQKCGKIIDVEKYQRDALSNNKH